MDIPFLDFEKQYKEIEKELKVALARIFDRHHYILGPELEAFEKEFAKYLGVKYVVGLNSGTDALEFCLRALDIKKGDEVITPANSYIATSLAISYVGAHPVLVDCDPETYQVDVKEIEKKITKNTKAILHGKKLGTFGNINAFSFYPGKNLGAYGDAGAIATDSKELYEKVKLLRNYGETKKYHHVAFGRNSRLDEVQAAVLRVKLKYIDKWNKARNKLALEYIKNLKGIKLQKIISGGISNYHLFVIEAKNRKKMQALLEKNTI